LNSILEAKNLSFSWGESPVFTEVGFDIQPRQIVAIVGVNGAGKSTLMKCLNRILAPSSGSVVINSKDVSKMPLLELAKQVSYVPQSVSTSFPLDVYDVVMLGRRPYISWRISDGDRAFVSDTISLFDLEDFAFRRFDQLSGGERQRVIIAKAVAQNPSLFLLDEPTSDLDLKNQIMVMKSIRKLVDNKDNNCSALIAIHDLNMAARFADLILMLHDGKMKAFGPPEEVFSKKNISEVFGVTSELISSTDSAPLRIHILDIPNDESAGN